MVFDPITKGYPCYAEWCRVRAALIALPDHPQRIPTVRMAIASLVRTLRGKGERGTAAGVLHYTTWLGYPVSDAQLDNRSH